MSTTKKIALTSLVPNNENPRIQSASNSTEAIREILECEGDELLNLSRKIIEKGWLTRQKIVVVKDDASKTYTVHDGNRRVIALQLLKGHIRAVPQGLKRAIEKMREDAKDLPDKVECLICDEHEADDCVDEAHSAADGGRGQKQWTPMMRSRHAYGRECAGKCKASAVPYRTSYRLMEAYLENISLTDPVRREIARDFEISTLDRLIAQWKALTKLDDDQLVDRFAPTDEADPAAKIIDSIRRGETKAKTIWEDTDQAEFLKKFNADTVPDKSRAGSTSKGNQESDPDKSKPKGGKHDPKSGTVGHVKSLLRAFEANGDRNAKVRSIKSEMQSCRISDCRISFCLLTRCLVEATVRSYAGHHNIPEFKDNKRLYFTNFLEEVVLHASTANSSNHMMKEDLKAGRAAFTGKSPMGWDWLCDISHKPSKTPKVEDICVHFEDIFPLVRALASH